MTDADSQARFLVQFSPSGLLETLAGLEAAAWRHPPLMTVGIIFCQEQQQPMVWADQKYPRNRPRFGRDVRLHSR